MILQGWYFCHFIYFRHTARLLNAVYSSLHLVSLQTVLCLILQLSFRPHSAIAPDTHLTVNSSHENRSSRLLAVGTAVTQIETAVLAGEVSSELAVVVDLSITGIGILTSGTMTKTMRMHKVGRRAQAVD